MKSLLKFSILSLSCIIAFSPFATVNAKAFDPCANLRGTWQGTEKYTNRHGLQCIWDVVTDFEVHDGYVDAQVIYYNGRQAGPEACRAGGTFTVQGSCRNAKLTLGEDWHGIIFNDSLVLEAQEYTDKDKVRTIEQYKKSNHIRELK